MKNKVLIKLLIPKMNFSADFFIPVNETVYKIKKLLLKTVPEMSHLSQEELSKYVLINKNTGRIYLNNEIVITTDIRNASELILFEKQM